MSRWRGDVPKQEVDPRFSRLAALALVNQMEAQAIWEWKPELLRPYRKRSSLGGGQKKKNGEVNSPTPDNQRAAARGSFRGIMGRRLLWLMAIGYWLLATADWLRLLLPKRL